MCFLHKSVQNRHDIVGDMKSRLLDLVKWIKLTVLFVLVASAIGQAECRTHTRHPHSASAHRRPTRADTRTNLSYEKTGSNGEEYTQTFVKQNTKIVLDCAVNINFSTSIWLKDGQIVQTILKDNTNNKRVIGHRFLVDATGNLFIDNVRLEDDGKWQCEAEDAFGFVVQGKPIQLTVLDAPKKAYLMIDNRILDPGNPFIPVKENADLTVSCVVDEGNPKPSLSWELALGSLALLDAPEVPLEVLNLTETTVDQKVGARNDAHMAKVLRAHHNATLTCFVRHIALEQPLNVSVLLNVQYTPSFAISREPGFGFPIREGMPVSLKCDVDSNPKAKPIWQKDDADPPVQQTPEGFLNFTEIRREHSGWYKCIARHMLGRFSSIGYFLNVHDMEVTQEPDFDIGELSSTGRQVEVSLGGAVQLACPPGTTGCWTRVEAGTGRLEPIGASQELRLDNVLYQEGGEYRCVSPSKESIKRLDAIRNALSVQVVVTGRPTVTPTNKSITAVYGQPLTLTMEFCANPPYNKVLWIAKNRKVYKPGDADKTIIAYGITNSSSPFCHQAVLFLTKVTTTDTGEYNFIVRSSNGLAEGNFFVNMTYASGYNVPQDEEESSSGCGRVILNTIYINVILLLLINC
ncbi:irregular chiasm C-roughest protein teiresias [Rhynchophorus ferrugineus]|uniref:irregular chiasm C-roughest protein teiresias n=1 Tax=Rhynchophorus ferrugineus TaxID=354439 RepID=UPI003FCDAA20